MICPKCGQQQLESDECSGCGIIIRKYLARASAPTPGTQKSRTKTTRYRFLQRERELAAFYDGQATMLGAGLSQSNAMAKFVAEPGKVKDLTPYSRATTELKTGATLSAGMARSPDYFPPHHTKLVAAGEVAGDPSVMFVELKSVVEQKIEMLQTIASETRKPVITGLLSFFLLPLPVLFSDNLVTYLVHSFGPLIIVALCWFVGRIIWSNAMRNPETALRADKMKFGFGLYRQYVIKQWVQVFKLLYAAGVPIADAYRQAADTTDNQYFKQELFHGETRLASGESLSQTMSTSGLFESALIGVITTGEAAGRLTQSLTSYISREREQFSLSLKRWTKGLTVAIGLLISLYVGARIIFNFLDVMPEMPV